MVHLVFLPLPAKQMAPSQRPRVSALALVLLLASALMLLPLASAWGCQSDSECDDGKFCNGQEKCKYGTCRAGTPPTCDDNIPCTKDYCDDVQNKCVHMPEDSKCDDGKFCNGQEKCDPVKGCVPGTPVNCDDNNPCTKDSCNEDQDKCVHMPEDSKCDDGKFCNGQEKCDPVKGCVPGTPVNCDDNNPCTKDSCDEDQDKCVHMPEDSKCDDGKFCNGQEKCDPVKGCVPGTPVNCDDNNPCTKDSCDEDQDKCVHMPEDSKCDDGKFCNGQEKCDPVKGCVPGTPVNCDDNDPCTKDSCDEDQDKCVHQDIPCACNSHSDCGPNKCCCSGSCTPRPPGVDCDLQCANLACKDKGGSSLTCACIKDCKGPWCSSVGGNPCHQYGVCCCAIGTGKSGSGGDTFAENCEDCDANCNGHPCTGNYVPGSLSGVCSQQI
eukprot:jgi/Mesvir1/22823/Mv20085-RA.1